jgi:hypothetical protein
MGSAWNRLEGFGVMDDETSAYTITELVSYLIIFPIKIAHFLHRTPLYIVSWPTEDCTSLWWFHRRHGFLLDVWSLSPLTFSREAGPAGGWWTCLQQAELFISRNNSRRKTSSAVDNSQPLQRHICDLMVSQCRVQWLSYAAFESRNTLVLK